MAYEQAIQSDFHHFPRYHIGESLIPQTYDYFEALGFLPKLKQSHFPEKHSVRFVSRDGRQASPFYFSEVLPKDKARTWQVDRAEFDQMMLALASAHMAAERIDHCGQERLGEF